MYSILESHLEKDEDKENDGLNSTIDDLTDIFGKLEIKESRKYLVGEEPSKTDNDVYKALVENATSRKELDQNLKRFPNVYLWIQVSTKETAHMPTSL